MKSIWKRVVGGSVRSPYVVLFTAFCLLPSAFSLFAAGGRYEVREIKPGIFVWIPEDIREQDGDPRFSRAANAGFIITVEGVLIVNTTNSPFHARELLYEIRRRTELPIRYVINTDAAGDRMLGNEVFADQETTIISTPAALTEMRRYQHELARRIDEDYRMQARMRGFHVTLPAQTFDPEMQLRLGGLEVRLLNLDPANPMGDCVVQVPSAKVAFVGELFENGYFPRVGERNVRGWVETLRRLQDWDVEILVPGRGALGGTQQLVEFREFLEWLTTEVESRIREGKPFSQVKRELDLTKKRPWRARELAPQAVESVYLQLAVQQLPPQ